GIGSVITTSAGEDFVFRNAGSIEMGFNGARSATTNIEREFDDGLNAAVRIRQAVETTDAAKVTIENSGTIVGGLDGNVAASEFSFTNSGLINGIDAAGYFQRGLTLLVGPLNLVLPDANDQFNADSATIVNTENGEIDEGFYAGVATHNLQFENRGRITASAMEGGTALFIETGLLQDGATSEDDDAESASFTNSGTIVGSVGLDAETSLVTINNSGDIARGLTPGAALFAEGAPGIEIEQETTLDAALNFTNSGTISTADYAGGAISIEVEAGNLSSGVLGAETAGANVVVVNSGTIAASGGSYLTPGNLINLPSNQVLIDFSTALAVNTDAEGVSSISITNQAGGVITARGAAHLGFSSGAQLIANQPSDASGVAIAALADRVTIVNNGTILAGPGGPLTLSSGVVLVPVNSDIDFENIIGSAIDTFGSADDVTNGATGVIEGGIALRSGDDVLRNYGTINGNVSLGGGNDTFIQSLLASYNGTADGGDGEDTLAFDITGATYTGTIDPALRQLFTGFEIEKIIGTGQVVTQQTVQVAGGGALDLTPGSSIVVAPGETAIDGGNESVSVSNSGEVVGNVNLGGGDNVMNNAAGGTITGNITTGDGANAISNDGGTITGSILAGAGADSVTNSGTITGDVDLGAGADTLTIGSGASFGGTVDAGGGADTLAFNTGSTYGAQTTIDGASFSGFEEVDNTAGVNSFTGDLETQQVNVTGGRLIGLAGSTLTGSVDVTSGGTFGTAGTVNGDVSIETGGTLSPGASPGIMTINGNLNIANGTTTTFEFVPVGQSDQIVVNGGSVTIGDNTTLILTGSLTPGASRDLIVVNDGGTITGDFDIVPPHPGIVGVLRNSGTTLQLLGTFVAPVGTTVQANAAIDYVNELLVAGTASTALINAVPTLLSGNTANTTAFGQLTPEAYASASQLGVEQGLALAKAGRSGLATTIRDTAGIFSFAQGLGNWRTLKGEGAIGTSSAKSHSYGVVGGIGFGNEAASIGAFIGYIDSRQTISGLGARTDADGVVAGLSGHFETNGLDASITLAHDWSNADTRRNVPGGTAVSGSYRLRSLVLDGSVGHSFSMGSWAVQPEVGLTHVSTRRGTATETGSTAFALAVDRAKTQATFIDGSVKLKGGVRESDRFHPWMEVGVRHQLEGERSDASAGFVGNSERFTVLGAGRKETMATAGAGASYDLAPGLSLYGAYQGEFGGGHSHNLNVGVHFNF
ncbi:autotransporter outer membrane beta-barrel domain-containing protein, partial [Novosphingobium sp.]|uniref:autotransporter outer membrane beta-barrel domain-containing protein n=1 Tax=Novosphingobium sp. TaxID=1874826 RepID=UPI002B4A80FE